MKGRILLVDDDPAIRTSLAEALGEEGYEVRSAEDADRALASLQPVPELVLSDVRMPGMSGLELLRLLRERAPELDVVLMTAYDDMPTVVAAMSAGAVDFLVKPLELRQLMTVVGRVFADRRARMKSRRAGPPASEVQSLVGRDPQMIQVFKHIGQAAGSRATVLIRGESGTGKELVARAIHDHSPWVNEPFVPVNCAALPPTLLESELFGHVRGAFTGALNARRGVFAQAASGTVFLDEIGDTTLEFQTRLLRVLQNREFQPVGAERFERTEARVVAATHQDLERLVTAGSFREDLYYRLRVVEIVLPPLRDRPGDIPTLAEHLVRKAARELAVSPPTLGDDALAALQRHAWPGNVRELENCLTRAVVLAAGSVIRPDHLALSARPDAAPASLTTLEQNERDHIAAVLVATQGNKARAAEILKISRPRLYRLIALYELDSTR